MLRVIRMRAVLQATGIPDSGSETRMLQGHVNGMSILLKIFQGMRKILLEVSNTQDRMNLHVIRVHAISHNGQSLQKCLY
jgi:hypothetical protein